MASIPACATRRAESFLSHVVIETFKLGESNTRDQGFESNMFSQSTPNLNPDRLIYKPPI